MNKATLLLLAGVVCAGSLTLAASAIAKTDPAGLTSIRITPARPDADTRAAIKLLESMPGFAEATWDKKDSVLVVAVADSAHFVPRELYARLRDAGMEVGRMVLHFEEVRAETNNGAYVYSPPNDLRFITRFSWNTQRFWELWGTNPSSGSALFRGDFEVVLAVPGAGGKVGPDSVDVLRFELSKPLYKSRKD